MDPIITPIVAALIAGAAQAAGSLANEELKKAYGALKSKILSLFGKDALVDVSVKAVEADAESPTSAAALTQALSAHDLTDPQLQELAQAVLQVAPQGRIQNALRLAENAVSENSKVTVKGAQGFTGTIDQKVELEKGARMTSTEVSVDLTGAAGSDDD